MYKEETIHLCLSIFSGLLVGYLSSNYLALIPAIIAGFLVDMDHLIDYAMHSKFKKFDLKEFLSGVFFDKSGKVYVVLHGYEYPIIFFVLALSLPNLGWLFYSISLSHLLHLIYDAVSNKPKWLTYSIIYRAINKFDHKYFNFKKD